MPALWAHRAARLFAVAAVATATLTGTSGTAGAAATPSWPQFLHDARHSGFNPDETKVTRDTIGFLNPEYIVFGPSDENFGSIAGSGTVVVGNTGYVGTTSGLLMAVPATGCGSDICVPRWTATLSNGVFSTPAVANGVVYVSTAGAPGTADGQLYAFAAGGCGRPTCTPLWTAVVPNVGSSPTASGGRVFIATSDGKLAAFAAAGCGAKVCKPQWTGSIGDSAQAAPAVANGVVYVTSSTRMFAFKAAGCGRATCPALWRTTPVQGVIQGSGPAIGNGNAYFGSVDFAGESISTLYAFNAAGCGTATCRPRFIAHPAQGDSIETTPTVAGNRVYVSATGFLYAFDANGCGAAVCNFLWLGILDGFIAGTGASPAVAGGVVYFTQNNGHVGAFDAKGCGDVVCSQIWSHIAQSTGSIMNSPAIVNGRLYVSGAIIGQTPAVFVYALLDIT
jgi:outer membrane protein assembly factor BamB